MKQLIDRLKGNKEKDKFAVGLDIGTSVIKIIKLKIAKDSMQICGFNSLAAQLDMEQVIKNITKSIDVTKVNISFSGPATILRYANFLKMNKAELRQALKFEAQKHIPFPVGDVNLDGHILKEDLPDNKMLVLLAAVKKEFLNKRLKIFDGAGIKVGIADIDSIAVINAFSHNYAQDEKIKNQVVALLNIGAAQSNLNILENFIPRFSRDIPVAGNNFSQKLADIMGIDFKEAELIKLGQDKSKLEKNALEMEPVIAHLASEIRVSFDYFESQSTSAVEKIFLSGGGSLYKGLKESLNSMLGLEVEYWNPLKQVKTIEGLDNAKLESISAQLAVAVGLSLRG